MTIQVRIPANMQALANNQPCIELPGTTVREVLDELVKQYPDIGPRLLTPEGAVQSFVNLFVGNQNIRQLQDLDTNLDSADELLIVAALAGG